MEDKVKVFSDANQLKVKKYKLERVIDGNATINIPREPIFYNWWNGRHVLGIFPRINQIDYPRFKVGDVCELKVISITGEAIRSFVISTHPEDISELIMKLNTKVGEEENLKIKILDFLMNYYDHDRSNFEFFEQKFKEEMATLSRTYTPA